MKVLSLFDGISCGRVALERAGFEVERYVAYEIDAHAIAISSANWPDIEHRGSVVGADFTEFEGFDLVLGGSPCQGFSFAGKGLNFDDPRSALFFEFVRALDEVKPVYFLLENVHMLKKAKNVITQYLGVTPYDLNSDLVSAQNRPRLYWTNIPGVLPPDDKGVMLCDIAETSGALGGRLVGRKINPQTGRRDDYNPDIPTLQRLELNQNPGKLNCLTTIAKTSIVLFDIGGGAYTYRNLTPTECERAQTLPDGYTAYAAKSHRLRALGNCWTVDMVAHILSFMHDVV